MSRLFGVFAIQSLVLGVISIASVSCRTVPAEICEEAVPENIPSSLDNQLSLDQNFFELRYSYETGRLAFPVRAGADFTQFDVMTWDGLAWERVRATEPDDDGSVFEPGTFLEVVNARFVALRTTRASHGAVIDPKAFFEMPDGGYSTEVTQPAPRIPFHAGAIAVSGSKLLVAGWGDGGLMIAERTDDGTWSREFVVENDHYDERLSTAGSVIATGYTDQGDPWIVFRDYKGEFNTPDSSIWFAAKAATGWSEPELLAEDEENVRIENATAVRTPYWSSRQKIGLLYTRRSIIARSARLEARTIDLDTLEKSAPQELMTWGPPGAMSLHDRQTSLVMDETGLKGTYTVMNPNNGRVYVGRYADGTFLPPVPFRSDRVQAALYGPSVYYDGCGRAVIAHRLKRVRDASVDTPLQFELLDPGAY